MELHTGVCGICNSGSLILNSQNSENYCNLIYIHFENELNIPSDSKTHFHLCPTCVYQITLINSKKNSLAKEYVGDELESNDKCLLCKQNDEVFKITDASFLNKCKPWKMVVKDVVSLCASCFYVIEIENNLKQHIMRALPSKNDESTGNQQHSPKQLTIIRRRKSTIEGGELSLREMNNTNLELNAHDREHSNELNSANSNYSIESTPVKKKRRRSQNLEEFFDEESKSLKRSGKSTEDFDLSSISQFSPLCKSNVHINKKYKVDDKMYNCIPYVKMHHFNETIADVGEDNYECSLVSHRPSMIRVRRTPPIKIKNLKQLGNIIKDKQNSPEKNEIKSTMINEHSKEILSKAKLVVKVERMKLEVPFKGNTSKEAITPKKKKRVHFNDTPIIIIPEDDYYDDYRSRRNTRISPERQPEENVSNVSIVDDAKKIEEERWDNEELITLSLDESDDESKDDFAGEINEESTEENESKTQTNEETASTTDVQSETEEILLQFDVDEINGENEKSSEKEEVDKERGKNEKDGLEECESESVHSQDEETCEKSDKKSGSNEILDLQEEESDDKSCSNEIIDIQEPEKESDGKSRTIEIFDLQEEESNDKTDEESVLNEVIDLQEEISNDKPDEATDHREEEEEAESVDKHVETCSNDIHVQDEESIEKSTQEIELIDIQDKNSYKKSTEKVDKELTEKVEDKDDEPVQEIDSDDKDDESVREVDYDEKGKKTEKDKEKTSQTEDTEMDSLDGFEIVDQEDADTIVKATEKVSSESDNIDEIESLVRKYCEEKKSTENKPVTKEEKAEIGDETKHESQEEKNNEGNNCNKKNKKQENKGEDFDSPIDEAEKCPTKTKDLHEKCLESTTLEEILNSSFDENVSDSPNSSKSANGNKGMKRNNSDDETVVSDPKKKKIDSS